MQTHRKALLAGAGLAGLAWAVQRWRSAQPLPACLRYKTALITGATRGLGLALARELAEARCRLVLCARSREELTGAAAELAARGAEVLPLVCDVSQTHEVKQMLEAARRDFGPIDILINNAGSIVSVP